MCKDPELKATLEAQLELNKKQIEAECDVYRQTGKGGVSEKFRELMDIERDLKKRINAIPHNFKVGDGAHTSNNGDRYPCRVVEVSKSGKSIKVVDMGYRAAKKDSQMGHQDWEVYDLPNAEEMGTTTYTLRKNGRWIREGCSLEDYWMTLYPGATFSRNWEF